MWNLLSHWRRCFLDVRWPLISVCVETQYPKTLISGICSLTGIGACLAHEIY